MSNAVRFAIRALALWMIMGMGLMAPPAWSELVDRIAVVVNDDIILLSELNKAMLPIAQVIAKQGYTEAQQTRLLKEQRALKLEEMIYEKLTDQQIERYGIKIDEQELDATIERIKAANRLTEERFRQTLAMDGMSYDEYRKQVKEKLLRRKLVNYEVQSKIVITDEDVKAYYDSQKARYQGKTKYHLRHILIKANSNAGELERTQGYQQAQNIYQRLKKGEPFTKLASVYSDAPTSKNEGELGVFEVNLLTDKARQALARIDKGQFTEIIETDQGYQIYFIEDIISAGGTSLAEAKTEIQDKLYAEQVDQKYRAWIQELRQKAHIQIME